jgi:hypothetical protein
MSRDFAEDKTLLTFDPTNIDTYQRDGYIEFQFSDGSYDDALSTRLQEIERRQQLV